MTKSCKNASKEMEEKRGRDTPYEVESEPNIEEEARDESESKNRGFVTVDGEWLQLWSGISMKKGFYHATNYI